jgi:hypothetical protein
VLSLAVRLPDVCNEPVNQLFVSALIQLLSDLLFGKLHSQLRRGRLQLQTCVLAGGLDFHLRASLNLRDLRLRFGLKTGAFGSDFLLGLGAKTLDLGR